MPRITEAAWGEEDPEPDRIEMMGDLLPGRA
jgi:hypothetical protein